MVTAYFFVSCLSQTCCMLSLCQPLICCHMPVCILTVSHQHAVTCLSVFPLSAANMMLRACMHSHRQPPIWCHMPACILTVSHQHAVTCLSVFTLSAANMMSHACMNSHCQPPIWCTCFFYLVQLLLTSNFEPLKYNLWAINQASLIDFDVIVVL